MEKLHDTQNQPDRRGIAIDRVGVRALRYPMQVRDKARSVQHTVATTALTVELPHHFKGTHMSRFVEVLQEFGPEIHVDNVPKLLDHLAKRLHADKAHVTFELMQEQLHAVLDTLSAREAGVISMRFGRVDSR